MLAVRSSLRELVGIQERVAKAEDKYQPAAALISAMNSIDDFGILGLVPTNRLENAEKLFVKAARLCAHIVSNPDEWLNPLISEVSAQYDHYSQKQANRLASTLSRIALDSGRIKALILISCDKVDKHIDQALAFLSWCRDKSNETTAIIQFANDFRGEYDSKATQEAYKIIKRMVNQDERQRLGLSGVVLSRIDFVYSLICNPLFGTGESLLLTQRRLARSQIVQECVTDPLVERTKRLVAFHRAVFGLKEKLYDFPADARRTLEPLAEHALEAALGDIKQFRAATDESKSRRSPGDDAILRYIAAVISPEGSVVEKSLMDLKHVVQQLRSKHAPHVPIIEEA
jgi:hypothetical protein